MTRYLYQFPRLIGVLGCGLPAFPRNSQLAVSVLFVGIGLDDTRSPRVYMELASQVHHLSCPPVG